MIIDQRRKLALRAPPRWCSRMRLDVRVSKAAHYLQQQGLAHPILVASPFALPAVRPWRTSAADRGAGHPSAQQPGDARGVCRRLQARAGDKAPR